ncbi:hypothetical protein MNBD_GAMMA26-1251 [hydrothermal vent metagenome]|uniref:Uncharacterized protein n=1 Tax=hydrothermal vent metagenome TaxID=652676 RepID=A0A3B1B0E6_9ZZZZ
MADFIGKNVLGILVLSELNKKMQKLIKEGWKKVLPS